MPACLDVKGDWCSVQAESWAFASDAQSLALLVDKGIFWTRTCKVCHGDEGIVVASEYGMSKAILEAGFNLGTLMARYKALCSEALPILMAVRRLCKRGLKYHHLAGLLSVTPCMGSLISNLGLSCVFTSIVTALASCRV